MIQSLSGKQCFDFLKSLVIYLVVSEKQHLLFRENDKSNLEILRKQANWTCHHGKTEEIKCMNVWPFRASICKHIFFLFSSLSTRLHITAISFKSMNNKCFYIHHITVYFSNKDYTFTNAAYKCFPNGFLRASPLFGAPFNTLKPTWD